MRIVKHLILTDYYSIFQINICFIKPSHLLYMEKCKFKLSAQTWNEEFELPDGSCSVSDIQDYFKNII